MNTGGLWKTVNRNLIAKAIGELAYEQVLAPIAESLNADYSWYNLPLQSGITYRFQAWKTVWEHLRVRPTTVRRVFADGESDELEAGQFFIDAKVEIGMNDIVLGNFLEEMQSTLFSDLRILEKYGNLSVEELSEMTGDELQSILNGHPKILLNKGRMGWGARDLEQFAPESATVFQVHWIAVRKDKCLSGLREGYNFTDLLKTSLSEQDLADFESRLKMRGLLVQDYFFMPVHPWQWDRILQIQFTSAISRQEIVSFGPIGDFYRPQISLRTLSNVFRPSYPDLKLPLTILNTSAVRGIPARYIASAPQVSAALQRICESDSLLARSNTRVLCELAGLSFRHPLYEQVEGAPYRYHETLGAIWRESVASKLAPGEIGILTGALFHQDGNGKSLIGNYIRKSRLSVDKWLRAYFDRVVVPLYHLQIKYGLGLVAHGQNVVLRMKNFIPHGVLLKDFQGDLRISSEFPKGQFPEEAVAGLDQLPPEYLIHDLLTGHFLTVLRFVSAVLKESDGFPETEFYRILSESVRDYLRANVPGDVDRKVSLLNEKIHRVLLNKVRFQIGYADSSERPKPALGTDLTNPLVGKDAHG